MEREWASVVDWVREAVAGVAVRQLRISPDSFIVIVLFSVCCILLIICYSMLLCCRGRRNSSGGSQSSTGAAKKELLCRKGLFALMFARLEEFDSLTPLIITPAGQAPSTSHDQQQQQPSTSRTGVMSSSSSDSRSPLLPLHHPLLAPSSSTSPPPPRRPNAGGKTLIVPLNASRYRVPASSAPLLGTPDSRVTSFDTGTTKSCATIPEDDEEVSPSPPEDHADLISIDRTSISCSMDVKSQRFIYPTSAYNLQIPMPSPHFQLTAPSYAPPEPPLQRPQRLRVSAAVPAFQAIGARFAPSRASPAAAAGSSSSSLGSPGSSVGSGGSPVETTGSLSDSFFANGHDAMHTLHYEMERCLNGASDSDAQSKYQLHRIEEESEHGTEEVFGGASGNSVGNGSGRPAQRQLNMPRSISEQFELLRQQQQTAS